MKKEILLSALFMFALEVVAAQVLEVKPKDEDIPETYVVKKGDTLWDISKKFKGDPFDWPSIWNRNKFIKDPHWIYPGQKLNLKEMLELLAAPPVKLKPLPKPEPMFISSAPRTLDSESKKLIETSLVSPPESLEVSESISTEEFSPRPVYSDYNYMRTGFITKLSELPKTKIIEIEGGSFNATKFDYITIDRGTLLGIKEGDIFAVLAVGDLVEHPETGEKLGVVVRIKGIIKIVSVSETRSRGKISENFDPIAEDDLVMPYRLPRGPMFDRWVKPEVVITGTILAVNEPMLSVHINDILYIDKGSEDGVKPGDRFVIYNKKEPGSSEIRKALGTIQAVKVMSNQTAVIVVSLKDMHIDIGDRVELSTRCRLIE